MCYFCFPQCFHHPFPSLPRPLSVITSTTKNIFILPLYNYAFLFRYKLTVYFILFFGSGLSVPFLAMRHQLLKK